VLIIGAGASGLSAAQRLSAAGLRVVILEARDRIGGRILTLNESSQGAAIELGAEFVHGRPPEIFDLLPDAHLQPIELAGESWFSHEGKLDRSERMIEGLEGFFAKMADPIRPDQSFNSFLQYWQRD